MASDGVSDMHKRSEALGFIVLAWLAHAYYRPTVTKDPPKAFTVHSSSPSGMVRSILFESICNMTSTAYTVFL
ncbi:hypothetical protein C8Q80DRAFT_1129343 [Daedaleopsis nitida]|nr:hypothetical protein C8Q80DRAFT_1129343 [Daedaleopsis nitida]